MLAGSGFQPLFTAALMQQFPTLQQFQSQLAHLHQQQSAAFAAAAAAAGSSNNAAVQHHVTPARKTRVGGSSVKTAKVWKYFDQLPVEEQAAECQLCRKKIKATNSSTTGMIRHLRSCHVTEYQHLQEARQTSMIMKMEEKTRAHLLREINEKVTNQVQVHANRKADSSHQKSPSSLSSASDTASSIAASIDSSPPFLQTSNMILAPLPPLLSSSLSSSALSALSPLPTHSLPPGLPAPKPLLPHQHVKMEFTEVEEDEDQPTELSTKPSSPSDGTTAFTVVGMQNGVKRENNDCSMDGPTKMFVNSYLEDTKINSQIAMMLLLDGQPPQTVDRPGFRSLVKLLLPSHILPSSDQFETEIIPRTITKLREDISAQFWINNPHAGVQTPLHHLSAIDNTCRDNEQLKKPMAVCRSLSQPTTVCKRDEDSDSASSADSERVHDEEREAEKQTREETQDSVVSVLSLCRCLSHFFTSHPLSTLSSPSPSNPNGTPDVQQDVAFVTNNIEAINSFLSQNPLHEIPQISESQKNLLRELNTQLQRLGNKEE